MTARNVMHYAILAFSLAGTLALWHAQQIPQDLHLDIYHVPGGNNSNANTNLNDLGGIDFNSANLNLQIKRDGNGVPLPISQQDLQNIKIDGLIPIIIDIRPATSLPIFAQLQNTTNPVNG